VVGHVVVLTRIDSDGRPPLSPPHRSHSMLNGCISLLKTFTFSSSNVMT
jgi:hypothetical protein